MDKTPLKELFMQNIPSNANGSVSKETEIVKNKDNGITNIENIPQSPEGNLQNLQAANNGHFNDTFNGEESFYSPEQMDITQIEVTGIADGSTALLSTPNEKNNSIQQVDRNLPNATLTGSPYFVSDENSKLASNIVVDDVASGCSQKSGLFDVQLLPTGNESISDEKCPILAEENEFGSTQMNVTFESEVELNNPTVTSIETVSPKIQNDGEYQKYPIVSCEESEGKAITELVVADTDTNAINVKNRILQTKNNSTTCNIETVASGSSEKELELNVPEQTISDVTTGDTIDNKNNLPTSDGPKVQLSDAQSIPIVTEKANLTCEHIESVAESHNNEIQPENKIVREDINLPSNTEKAIPEQQCTSINEDFSVPDENKANTQKQENTVAGDDVGKSPSSTSEKTTLTSGCKSAQEGKSICSNVIDVQNRSFVEEGDSSQQEIQTFCIDVENNASISVSQEDALQQESTTLDVEPTIISSRTTPEESCVADLKDSKISENSPSLLQVNKPFCIDVENNAPVSANEEDALQMKNTTQDEKAHVEPTVTSFQVTSEENWVTGLVTRAAAGDQKTLQHSSKPRKSVLINFDPIHSSRSTNITPTRSKDLVEEEALLLGKQQHLIGKTMAEINDKLVVQEEENAELKLQLNASQQLRASLELQLRQKEEIIIKSQAEALRKDQEFQQEIKQLKEKLDEKCTENDNTQAKELQETVKSLKSHKGKLICELNAHKNDEQNYRKIMEEYENTIGTRLSELQKLNEEHNLVKQHLANLELAFSDVLQKYERSKKIIDAYKCNEEALRETLLTSEDSVLKSEEKYESLKAHAKAQIEKSNQEMQLLHEQYESEIHKLSAIIRRLEIKNASLVDSLDQKKKECRALAALCDEVTGKV